MKRSITVAAMLAFWAGLIALAAILQTTQNAAVMKNRIANPYQDSRALWFGSKPRATYTPTIETWRDGR